MIEPEYRVQRPRDPSAVSAWGTGHVTLDPSVAYVKAGTPLRPGPGGWVPSRDGSGAEFVAVDGKFGGEDVGVARGAILKLARPTLTPGHHLRIADVDDNGLVSFDCDPDGPFVAMTASTVLVDMAARGGRQM